MTINLYRIAIKLLTRWGIKNPEQLLDTYNDNDKAVVICDLLIIHTTLKQLYPAVSNSDSLYQIDVLGLRDKRLNGCRPVDLLAQNMMLNAAMLRKHYQRMLQR